MLKLAVVGMTALFVSASAAQAQGPASSDFPTAADMKFMTDVRVELVKSALQLTPAQEKLWPAVEQAIRARAETKQQRLQQLASAGNDDQDKNALEMLRKRADLLNQRATGFKKLADAWQPLYESLDNGQKTRLRFVTLFALREMRDRVASRLAEYEEDDSDSSDMPTWGMHFTSGR
jgi:hypothetical protein